MKFSVVGAALAAMLATACGGNGTTTPTTPPPQTPTTPAPTSPGGPTETDDPDAWLEDLVAAAQAEGEVNFYTATSPGPAELVAQTFNERYGIHVEVLRLASGPLSQRFMEEHNAGVHIADVLQHGTAAVFRADEENNGPIFKPLTVEEFPLIELLPDSFVYPRTLGLIVTLVEPVYNIANVDPSEIPSSWCDYDDPAWNGRLLLVDPRTASTNASFYLMLEEECGEDYLPALAALNPGFVEGAANAVQQVAAGEYDLTMPNNAAQAVGLLDSVGVHRELDFTTGYENETAIPADAPNPNAARLFLHWLMTEEGQTALNGFETARVSPLYEGLEGTVPLPSNYISPDPIEAAANMDRLAGIFGLN